MYHACMTKIVQKTKPGWAIPTDIKESFVNFCAHIGAIAQEDAAGALFLWQFMPERVREWAKLAAKGAPPVKEGFWQGLRKLIDASTPELSAGSNAAEAKKSAKG